MPTCVYCQQRPATTRDHIPPKTLFARPLPSDLITVPACGECNTAFGRDDEYFARISLAWAAAETPDGSDTSWRVLRSVRRKEAKRFARNFYRTLTSVEVRTRAGVYVADSLQFTLDRTRILGTINRIIRGLYFHVVGSSLPLGDYVRSMDGPAFFRLKPVENQDELLNEVLKRPPLRVGKAFSASFLFDTEQPHTSFWVLLFYGQLMFIGVTGGVLLKVEGAGSDHPPA